MKIKLTVLFYLILKFAFAQEIKYTVFLIGDAGEPEVANSPNILLLKKQLDAAGEKSAVIFLGDNIYPAGLPDKGHKQREKAEIAIEGQMDILKDYPGKIFFIPGNHDWRKGKEYGLERVKNQEAYVESYLNRGNVFLPDNGCGGPVTINLPNDIVLIIYDSQWLLYRIKVPGKKEGCQYDNRGELMAGIADILRKNKDKKLLLAAHHPVYTYGIHGGITTWKDHIFPLTEIKDWLYIPLPLIGSIYPSYRIRGDRQDTNHPVYRGVRSFLIDQFEKYPGLIHVSGHEHSLQYNYKDAVHYIVSGAGSKTTFVKKTGYSRYAESELGFAKLIYKTDDVVELEFWQPDEDSSDGKLAYKETLLVR